MLRRSEFIPGSRWFSRTVIAGSLRADRLNSTFWFHAIRRPDILRDTPAAPSRQSTLASGISQLSQYCTPISIELWRWSRMMVYILGKIGWVQEAEGTGSRVSDAQDVQGSIFSTRIWPLSFVGFYIQGGAGFAGTVYRRPIRAVSLPLARALFATSPIQNIQLTTRMRRNPL